VCERVVCEEVACVSERVVCEYRRAKATEGDGRETDGSAQQKQEPHTKMRGKTQRTQPIITSKYLSHP